MPHPSKSNSGGAPLRITPSKLGAFTVPNACDACLFGAIRMNFKKPFDFGTPAIMQDLDVMQKQLVDVSLKVDGELPKYFGKFRDAVGIWPLTSLSTTDPITGLPLYGKPDLLLLDDKGSVFVLDNKSCQPKEEGSDLFAKYATQVNFYGYLIENLEAARKVRAVGLMHYTVDKPADDEMEGLLSSSGLMVPMKPTLREIPYDPETYVIPFLKKVKQLMEMDECPEGNKDCSDCKLLKQWTHWIQERDSSAPPFPLRGRELAEFEASRHFALLKQSDSANIWKDDLLRLAKPNGAIAAWIEDDD